MISNKNIHVFYLIYFALLLNMFYYILCKIILFGYDYILFYMLNKNIDRHNLLIYYRIYVSHPYIESNEYIYLMCLKFENCEMGKILIYCKYFGFLICLFYICHNIFRLKKKVTNCLVVCQLFLSGIILVFVIGKKNLRWTFEVIY